MLFPTIFQLPAVGLNAPPVFPVMVSAAPLPFKVTKPLASTENLALSKAANPTFEALVEAMA